MSETLARISDVEALEIGKRYLVSSALVLLPIAGYSPGEYVPIMGELHTDPELNSNWQHFHYDWRFIPEFEYRTMKLSLVINQHSSGSIDLPKMVAEEPVWKPHRCYRLTVDHPPFSQVPSAYWLRFEHEYKSVLLSDCRVCPHRGFDLRHISADENGVLLCPGHFLRWNVETKKLVPRWSEDDE